MAIDYTSIEEVINDFQLMADDTSYDKDAALHQVRLLALHGLRELTFDVEQNIKTSLKAVSATTLSIILPDDFVKAIKIGFVGTDEKVHPLGLADDLRLDSSYAGTVTGTNPAEPFYNTYSGRKFGVGGGNNANGYYRLNRNDNTIQFSSDVSGKTIVLEYISDGISSIQPRGNIIKMKFNGASNIYQTPIVDGNIISVPNSTGGVSEYKLSAAQPTTANLLGSYAVHFLGGDTAEAIAEKFTKVVNEGYPEWGIKRADKNIRASNSGDEVIITTINLSVKPTHVKSSLIRNNVSAQENLTGVPIKRVTLIQEGVIGESPRVHKFCEEALRSFMYWKFIDKKRGIPMNEKIRAKKEYYNQKRLAKARMLSFTKEEALQSSRKGFKQSPKF